MAGLVPAIHVLNVPALSKNVDARDTPGHDGVMKERRILDPAPLFGRYLQKAHAAFSRPSIFSAACTFGRAATRSLKAIRFLNSDKSMPVRSAHFSITNR
jgi:hypothetical protein